MVIAFLFLIISLLQAPPEEDERIITEKLINQLKCWNSGDIECFMNDYWKNDSLMYIGKNGITYGWQNTLDRYHKNYPDKKAMGHLDFEIIKLEKLGEIHYFVVGRWKLARETGELSGYFSLIWKKVDGEWVIISDHSS